MRVSALERVFLTERVHRRATVHGDFAHAVLHERSVAPDEGPFVVTTKRASFVQTRRRPDGTIWAGFSDVPLDAEGGLMRELHTVLWRLSQAHGWGNRCTSLAEALPRMQSLGFEPRQVVVPMTLLREASGNEGLTTEDAEKLMLTQGHVVKLGEVVFLVADLPPGTAIVTAAPTLTGAYTRADEALALMVFRADRAVVLVGQADHGVA